jgi:signal transduction histidine kinase
MLTGVTHDLRTPLTIIKAQAQLLHRRLQPEHLPNVEQIERASARMERWINELLEASTVTRPQDLELDLSQADLVGIARQAVHEHQSASRRHDVRLVTEARRVVGLFDAPRLERVLDNLIGNAIKYSPNGGCVRVSVESHDGWAVLSVRDDGLGIPPVDLPHIFEPFRRGSNVVGRMNGTGIGLANAKHIVERHGGTLSVESVLGKGSIFTVRLPLATKSPN